MQAVLEFEAKRGSDFEKSNNPSANPRPAVEDLKRFSNKLEEEIRQKEVFKDVSGGGGGGGRVKALRGIVGNPTTPSKGGKKLDSLSPLGSRKMKEVDMNVVPKFGRDQGVLGGGSGKSSNLSSKMRGDLNSEEDVIIGPGGGVGTSISSSNSTGRGGRKRAQLKTMVATGKFEEGLEADDMKFFS